MHSEPLIAYLRTLQNTISQALEAQDSTLQCTEDRWTPATGGSGCTRSFQGRLFEKAGVNFSYVRGMQLPPAASVLRKNLDDAAFEAMGISVIVHPNNPYVPTTHFNVRCFLVHTSPTPTFWFGGGFDLTPYYAFEEDAQHWHTVAKAACDPFDVRWYPRYKQWCDEYFYLPHRQETRGVGGLFFDDVAEPGWGQSFAFVQSVGNAFLRAYMPIVERRSAHPFDEREKRFQCYRRGRYVEFNLLYDRGTLFGLQSQGRTESILLSLPPQVTWHYGIPAEHHEDAAKLAPYLRPRAWIPS